MDKKPIMEALKKITAGKRLFIIGIAGILLIGLTSFSTGPDKSEEKAEAAQLDTQQYVTDLENRIKEVVQGLTGDKNARVIITLETGIRREYAGESQDSASQKNGESGSDTTTDRKEKVITVKTSDGNEQALLITEYMPQIRGVAIVCNIGGKEETREALTAAVTAALGITSKRVYIGGNVQ